MSEYDKVGFVLSPNISCAAGLLLLTSFVAQFGTCPPFIVHLRLQSGYTDKLYAQGKLLSPAEQSHVNSVWSEGTLISVSVPLDALPTLNYDNNIHQQCL